MFSEESKQNLLENYQERLRKHGYSPEGAQMSAEGQAFRFAKLAEIGNLAERTVLDLGCGLGHFYAPLRDLYPTIQYTGLDILPEMIAGARVRHPDGDFMCRDILRDGVDREFDYVLISAMFNNDVPGCTDFLRQMVEKAFSICRIGLGFNFISNRANFTSSGIANHDPVDIFEFCIDRLSRKINLYHHYARADVSIFVYR